jgi:hypothetical protein
VFRSSSQKAVNMFITILKFMQSRGSSTLRGMIYAFQSITRDWSKFNTGRSSGRMENS